MFAGGTLPCRRCLGSGTSPACVVASGWDRGDRTSEAPRFLLPCVRCLDRGLWTASEFCSSLRCVFTLSDSRDCCPLFRRPLSLSGHVKILIIRHLALALTGRQIARPTTLTCYGPSSLGARDEGEGAQPDARIAAMQHTRFRLARLSFAL